LRLVLKINIFSSLKLNAFCTCEIYKICNNNWLDWPIIKHSILFPINDLIKKYIKLLCASFLHNKYEFQRLFKKDYFFRFLTLIVSCISTIVELFNDLWSILLFELIVRLS